jgi:hypothetical protein
MRAHQLRLLLVLCLLALLPAVPAEAYIGPGLGAGALAVVFGTIASITMGFFAVLWYPAKRLLRRRKAAKSERAQSEAE